MGGVCDVILQEFSFKFGFAFQAQLTVVVTIGGYYYRCFVNRGDMFIKNPIISRVANIIRRNVQRIFFIKLNPLLFTF